MNSDQSNDDNDRYFVVMDEAGLYAVLPAISPVPHGWVSIGPPRTRQECLTWISANWADMYPSSLGR